MNAKDMLGCTGLAALFLMGTVWVPFLGPFFSLLTPLPFLYYSVKLGSRQGVKLAALTVLTVGLAAKLAGIAQIFLFAAEFAILGLFLAELFRRNLSIAQTVFLATAFMLVLAMVFVSLVALSSGKGPVEMILGYLQSHLQATLQSYGQMGVSPEKTAQIEAYGKAVMDLISRIYPSLMILGTGFVVWINVMIGRAVLRMRKLNYPAFEGLERWRAPDSLVWVVIVTGFALFLSSGVIKLLAINTLIVMMAVYVFHGLSILLFFFAKYRVPVWVRICVYFFIVVQQVFLAILALAGLFDQWVDFRKIHKRTQS